MVKKNTGFLIFNTQYQERLSETTQTESILVSKMRKETDSYGTIYYYNDLNQLHREDGPAIECANGTKCWYRNGQRHREDGPAIECADGNKSWYRNGQLHREDGPAIEFANGKKEYWLLGIQYKTKKDYLQRLKLKAFW